VGRGGGSLRGEGRGREGAGGEKGAGERREGEGKECGPQEKFLKKGSDMNRPAQCLQWFISSVLFIVVSSEQERESLQVLFNCQWLLCKYNDHQFLKITNEARTEAKLPNL
jgi:hypothetical protein